MSRSRNEMRKVEKYWTTTKLKQFEAKFGLSEGLYLYIQIFAPSCLDWNELHADVCLCDVYGIYLLRCANDARNIDSVWRFNGMRVSRKMKIYCTFIEIQQYIFQFPWKIRRHVGHSSAIVFFFFVWPVLCAVCVFVYVSVYFVSISGHFALEQHGRMHCLCYINRWHTHTSSDQTKVGDNATVPALA